MHQVNQVNHLPSFHGRLPSLLITARELVQAHAGDVGVAVPAHTQVQKVMQGQVGVALKLHTHSACKLCKERLSMRLRCTYTVQCVVHGRECESAIYPVQRQVKVASGAAYDILCTYACVCGKSIACL